MMIPTVHMNGTAGKDLQAELQTAHEALQQAIDALRQVTVHGRDYYVQGPSAYAQARHEMDARVTALGDVLAELQTMYQAVYQQNEQRASARGTR